MGQTLPAEVARLASDAEWVDLIARLRDRKHLLVRDFLARFDGRVQYGGLVSGDDIDDLVANTMEMYLLLLAGRPLPPELQRLPADLGARRARQGVPAHLLLEGVRTNSRVIWSALREIAEPELAVCLVRNTDSFLGLVEWHVQEVQSAHALQTEQIHRRSESFRRRSLRELFESPAPGEDALAAVCAELGVAVDAEFELAVQLRGPMDECALCLVNDGGVEYETGSATIHFRQLSADATGVLGAHPGSAYFARIRGASGLRDAAQLGQRLLLARPSGRTEAITPANSWAGVAWRALRDFYPEGLFPVDPSAMSALSEPAQWGLVETASTYLSTGSIKATSELLFCHRNTIVKRLAKLERMLGLRFSHPRESALIVLALTEIEGTS